MLRSPRAIRSRVTERGGTVGRLGLLFGRHVRGTLDEQKDHRAGQAGGEGWRSVGEEPGGAGKSQRSEKCQRDQAGETLAGNLTLRFGCSIAASKTLVFARAHDAVTG